MLNYKNIDLLFKNSYVQINTNHNEAIDVYRNYKNISNKQIPILINFDTHSDLYWNEMTNFSRVNIAQWVNRCISNFNLDEFYWVIPDYIYENIEYREIYEKKDNLWQLKAFRGSDINDIDLDKINKEELLFNNNTGEVISNRRKILLDNNCKRFNMPSVFDKLSDFRNINVYIITKNKLNLLSNKEVFLSIDADYFCNSGFDTMNYINNKNTNSEELTERFNSFTQALLDSGVNPVCVSLTYSPIYFPSKFRNDIEKFFNAVKNAANQVLY